MEKYNFYKVGENDIFAAHETKGIVSLETSKSLSVLEKISELEYKIIIDGKNMQLASLGKQYLVVIEKYEDLLSDPLFQNIRLNIEKAKDKYGIDFTNTKKTARKLKRENKYANATIKKGVCLAIVATLGVSALYLSTSKNSPDVKTEIGSENFLSKMNYEEEKKDIDSSAIKVGKDYYKYDDFTPAENNDNVKETVTSESIQSAALEESKLTDSDESVTLEESKLTENDSNSNEALEEQRIIEDNLDGDTNEFDELITYCNNSETVLKKFFNCFLKIYGNEYTKENIMNTFYEISKIPLIDKINAILERTGMTREQLDFVVAFAMAEAWGNGDKYETVYAAASTMYNRTCDKAYTDEVSRDFKNEQENAGFNLYYQVIERGQFAVYSDGSYKKFLGKTDKVGYKAAIDMFYLGMPMHDYLNFLGNEYTPEGIKESKNLSYLPEQFFEHDNIYYTHLTSDRRVEPISKNLT